MFAIPFRHTLQHDLSNTLAVEIKRQSTNYLSPDSGRSVDGDATKDANSLDLLRRTATSDFQCTDSNVLLDYLGGLLALSSKTELSEVSFPWTNALGYSTTVVQGSGIWFEILNITVNIAALYTVRASGATRNNGAQHYQQAAGALEFAEAQILPHLTELPPPELSKESLNFLRELCLAQALDLLSNDGTVKWQAYKQYENVLELLQQLEFKNVDWEHNLKGRCRELGSRAYLEIAKSLHRSRRIEDRRQEKAAILKCIELTKSPRTLAEAKSMLHEPFSRRSKASLIDVDDASLEIPKYYLERKQVIEPIKFNAPASTLFSKVLPVRLMAVPSLLSEKLHAKLTLGLCSELYSLNRRTLLAIASYHIPATVELAHAPDKIPEFLTRLIHDLPTVEQRKGSSKSGVEYSHLFTLLGQNRTELSRYRRMLFSSESGSPSGDRLILQDRLREAETLLAKIDSRFKTNQEIIGLLSLPDRDEKLLAVLKISPRAHPSKCRSKPVFLTKVETFYNTMQAHIKDRDLRRARIMHEVNQYDFHTAVLNIAELSKNSTESGQQTELALNALDAIVDEALSTFADDFSFLDQERQTCERHISKIKELEAQFRTYRKPLLLDNDKITATQALVLAIVLWSDLHHDLSQFTDTLAKLGTLISRVSERPDALTSRRVHINNAVSMTSEEPTQFCWKPGMKINITS